jgi:hypothetical protein
MGRVTGEVDALARARRQRRRASTNRCQAQLPLRAGIPAAPAMVPILGDVHAAQSADAVARRTGRGRSGLGTAGRAIPGTATAVHRRAPLLGAFGAAPYQSGNTHANQKTNLASHDPTSATRASSARPHRATKMAMARHALLQPTATGFLIARPTSPRERNPGSRPGDAITRDPRRPSPARRLRPTASAPRPPGTARSGQRNRRSSALVAWRSQAKKTK